jgi:hypothetical protein
MEKIEIQAIASLAGEKIMGYKKRLSAQKSRELRSITAGTRVEHTISSDKDSKIATLSMEIAALNKEMGNLRVEALLSNPAAQGACDKLFDEQQKEQTNASRIFDNYVATAEEAEKIIKGLVLNRDHFMRFVNSRHKGAIDESKATSIGDALSYVMDKNLRVIDPDGNVLHSYNISPSAHITSDNTLYLIQASHVHYTRGVPTSSGPPSSSSSSSSTCLTKRRKLSPSALKAKAKAKSPTPMPKQKVKQVSAAPEGGVQKEKTKESKAASSSPAPVKSDPKPKQASYWPCQIL